MTVQATQAVILAAGRGTRLGNQNTNGLPKCLLQFGDRSLLSHQVAALEKVGVQEIVVVTGFRHDEVVNCGHLLQNSFDVQIKFVENREFATTNTIYSLYVARKVMSKPFFLLNGDVLFDRRIVRLLQDDQRDSVLATEVKDCGKEEVKVDAGANERIQRLSKQLDPATALGEFVGIARFGPLGTPALDKSLEVSVEQERRRTDYFEHAIDRIASQTPFHVLPFDSLPVIEIDFPKDLERATSHVLPLLQPS